MCHRSNSGWRWLFIALLCAPIMARAAAPQRTGTVVDAVLESRALAGNLVGVETRRSLKVYLPPGYDTGKRRYPVIYYVHNSHWSARQLFEQNHMDAFLDRAIADHVLGEVILVAGDFTTASGYNFFSNESVSGRWVDHVALELVPYVDARFRTRADAASRAITGDFFGGYAALKLALLHAETFGVVYALHPVGTGTGQVPGIMRPDWNAIHSARSWADIQSLPYTPVFAAMSQAYLPNASRPPFFCDFMVERENGQLVVKPENVRKLHEGFLLDHYVAGHAADLKRLRAIKLDWGRYDLNQDHVLANQQFSRRLDEYGITHFAEEYSGNQYDRLWTANGRVEGDLLPFLAKFLEGAAPARAD